jgi:hypothetical protein
MDPQMDPQMDPSTFIPQIDNTIGDNNALLTTINDIDNYYRRYAMVRVANIFNLESLITLLNRRRHTTTSREDIQYLLQHSDIINQILLHPEALYEEYTIARFMDKLLKELITSNRYLDLSNILTQVLNLGLIIEELAQFALQENNIEAMNVILTHSKQLDLYNVISSISPNNFHNISVELVQKALLPPIEEKVKLLLDLALGYSYGQRGRQKELRHIPNPAVFRFLFPLASKELQQEILEKIRDPGRRFDDDIKLPLLQIVEYLYTNPTIDREDKLKLLRKGYYGVKINNALAPIFYPTEDEARRYVLLRRQNKSLEERITELRTLPDTLSTKQMVDTLQARITGALAEQYKPEGKEAKETILNLYRKAGLIEKSTSLPVLLIPGIFKEVTLAALTQEKDFSLAQSPEAIKIINYVHGKGIPLNITAKADALSGVEGRIWFALSGEYIVRIDGKVYYLTKAGMLISPSYEELEIEVLEPGVLTALY